MFPDTRHLETEVETSAPKRSPSVWHGVVFILVLVVAAFAVRVTPLREVLDSAQDWTARIGTGPSGVGLFIGMTAVLLFLGVPRLAFCFVGGMTFGFAEGLLWSQVGTLIGAYALFNVARWGARDWARRAVSAYPRLARLVDTEPTLWTVILVRQLPAPAFVPNLALGMTPVRHGTFLGGSLIGFLPEAVVAALAGSGMINGGLAEALPRIVAALGLFLILAYVLRRFVSKPAVPATT